MQLPRLPSQLLPMVFRGLVVRRVPCGPKEKVPGDSPGLAILPLAPTPSRAPSPPHESKWTFRLLREASGAAHLLPAGGKVEMRPRSGAPSGASHAGRGRGRGHSWEGQAWCRTGTTGPQWGLGAAEEAEEGGRCLKSGVWRGWTRPAGVGQPLNSRTPTEYGEPQACPACWGLACSCTWVGQGPAVEPDIRVWSPTPRPSG